MACGSLWHIVIGWSHNMLSLCENVNFCPICVVGNRFSCWSQAVMIVMHRKRKLCCIMATGSFVSLQNTWIMHFCMGKYHVMQLFKGYLYGVC